MSPAFVSSIFAIGVFVPCIVEPLVPHSELPRSHGPCTCVQDPQKKNETRREHARSRRIHGERSTIRILRVHLHEGNV